MGGGGSQGGSQDSPGGSKVSQFTYDPTRNDGILTPPPRPSAKTPSAP